MLDKLRLINDKYSELEDKMASPEYYNDPSAIRRFAREQKELTLIVDTFREYLRFESSIRDAEALLKNGERPGFPRK